MKEILKEIIKEKYENRPFIFGVNKANEEIYKLELILESIDDMEQNCIPLSKAIEAKESNYRKGYIQGYSDCEVKAKPLYTLGSFRSGKD